MIRFSPYVGQVGVERLAYRDVQVELDRTMRLDRFVATNVQVPLGALLLDVVRSGSLDLDVS